MGQFCTNCVRFDGIRKDGKPWNHLTNCTVFAEGGTCKLHRDSVLDRSPRTFVDHCPNWFNIQIESYSQEDRRGYVSWSRGDEMNPGKCLGAHFSYDGDGESIYFFSLDFPIGKSDEADLEEFLKTATRDIEQGRIVGEKTTWGITNWREA